MGYFRDLLFIYFMKHHPMIFHIKADSLVDVGTNVSDSDLLSTFP